MGASMTTDSTPPAPSLRTRIAVDDWRRRVAGELPWSTLAALCAELGVSVGAVRFQLERMGLPTMLPKPTRVRAPNIHAAYKSLHGWARHLGPSELRVMHWLAGETLLKDRAHVRLSIDAMVSGGRSHQPLGLSPVTAAKTLRDLAERGAVKIVAPAVETGPNAARAYGVNWAWAPEERP